MTLIHYNHKKLEEIKDILGQLSSELYTKPNAILSGSSIGQHFRHILEFYVCLVKGCEKESVCYDERERNLLLETNIEFAIETIDEISVFLGTVILDHQLSLRADYSEKQSESVTIPTSLFRELAFVLDHAIHHLAIIKIGLSSENIDLNSVFGVAPSTLRYREKCAQ